MSTVRWRRVAITRCISDSRKLEWEPRASSLQAPRWRAAAGRHWRYDSGFTDARSGWGPHRRSTRCAADTAISEYPQLHAAGDRLPWMRPHYQHFLPGNGAADSVLPARSNAGMEGALHRRGRNESRGDGLRRERPRRIEARQSRHLIARDG